MIARPTVEVYWLPRCANCLRLKEFVEHSGQPFMDVNLAEEPAAAKRLRLLGVRPPAVVVGDRAVRGLDLVEVARLIGYDYRPPEILDPAELKERFETVVAALCRYTWQLPVERLGQRLAGSGRSVRFLVAHTGTVMRKFVEAYDGEIFDSSGAPPDALATNGSAAELVDWAAGTAAVVENWWIRWGHDDPFDRVLETTWGFRTLHEVFESAVWHTARHTTELASWLTATGIPPDSPLTEADLAGLTPPSDQPGDTVCWTMTQRRAG